MILARAVHGRFNFLPVGLSKRLRFMAHVRKALCLKCHRHAAPPYPCWPKSTLTTMAATCMGNGLSCTI